MLRLWPCRQKLAQLSATPHLNFAHATSHFRARHHRASLVCSGITEGHAASTMTPAWPTFRGMLPMTDQVIQEYQAPLPDATSPIW